MEVTYRSPYILSNQPSTSLLQFGEKVKVGENGRKGAKFPAEKFHYTVVISVKIWCETDLTVQQKAIRGMEGGEKCRFVEHLGESMSAI